MMKQLSFNPPPGSYSKVQNNLPEAESEGQEVRTKNECPGFIVPHRCLIPLLLFASLATFSCSKPSSEDHSGAADDPQKLQHLAKALAEDLEATERQAAGLAEHVLAAYSNFVDKAESIDSTNYRLEPNGVLHRPEAVKTDVPAVFVSGAVAVDERILTIVKGTESIDPFLKKLIAPDGIVVQAYYNDHHSYNRIYPPFNVLTQYPPGMAITNFNFYYLADERHNPERKVTWIKIPYADPAGRGWMISCLAPVYRSNKLEGVCGLDITVESLVRELNLEDENCRFVLVSNEGIVVAVGETMSRILRLPGMNRHRYVDTVRSDTLRADDYNLRKSSSILLRKMFKNISDDRMTQTDLDLDGKKWTVFTAPVKHIDWMLLEFRKRP